MISVDSQLWGDWARPLKPDLAYKDFCLEVDNDPGGSLCDFYRILKPYDRLARLLVFQLYVQWYSSNSGRSRMTLNWLEILHMTNSKSKKSTSAFRIDSSQSEIFYLKIMQNLGAQLQVLTKLWGFPDSEQTGGEMYISPPQFSLLASSSFKS